MIQILRASDHRVGSSSDSDSHNFIDPKGQCIYSLPRPQSHKQHPMCYISKSTDQQTNKQTEVGKGQQDQGEINSNKIDKQTLLHCDLKGTITKNVI